MIGKPSLLAPLALAVLLCACQQKNTGDEPASSGVAFGLDRFLLFPNPIAQTTGGFETDTDPYAEAYYHDIDSNNDKDTIDKWKAQNGFTGIISPNEHLVVFRDVKDLGYGRRMTGRLNGHQRDRGEHRVVQHFHCPTRGPRKLQFRREVREVLQFLFRNGPASVAGGSRRQGAEGDARPLHHLPRRARRSADSG